MDIKLSRFYGYQPHGPVVGVTITTRSGTVDGGSCSVICAHALVDEGATGMTHADLDALVEEEANAFLCRGFGSAKTDRYGRILTKAGTNPFLD